MLKLFYFASALPKVLIAALKYKKGSRNDMKENLNFKQSRLNYINNQKQKQQKKEHLRLFSVEVDIVVKIDDETYVLSIIKIYSYFSFLFSVVPKKVELLKILKVM